MKTVSEVGRVFILLANLFRKNKVELVKVPMYMIADDPFMDEIYVYTNDENQTDEEIIKMGLRPHAQKWLKPNK